MLPCPLVVEKVIWKGVYIFWKIIKLGKKETGECILRVVWGKSEKGVDIATSYKN